jgi:hypothetical protein
MGRSCRETVMRYFYPEPIFGLDYEFSLNAPGLSSVAQWLAARRIAADSLSEDRRYKRYA